MKTNLSESKVSWVTQLASKAVELWKSLNKLVLAGILLMLTLVCTLCFPVAFFKILFILEVIGISIALLVTTSADTSEDEKDCIEFDTLKDGYEFIQPNPNGIKFNDLFVKEPTRELTPLLNFVKDIDRHSPTDIYFPETHILLVGESGSGKNALIRAFANEADLHIIKVHASRFFENEDLLESLFEIAPHIERYIIVLESFETLYTAAASTGNAVFSDIIVDKLQKYLEVYPNVILFATCDDPSSLISDSSYQRCFKKIIVMESPDFKERRALLEEFTNHVELSNDVNFDALTKLCVGFSIGEIKELVKTAVEIADKNDHVEVTQNDFFDAYDSFSCGSVHDKKHTTENQKLVAYHEAGHAIMEYILAGRKSVIRVLSTSRGTAGGYTLMTTDEEKIIISRQELLDRICTLYGGRCAERIVFGALSTGASADIQAATSIISSMVQNYGMSEEIGPLNVSPKIALMAVLNESNDMRNLISRECIKIAKECDERTMKILTENLPMLDALANYLIENESISGKEMNELLSKFDYSEK